jgi:hypothetical protein
MFPHIIRNLKLARNPQNIWKYHKIRLAEIDTKLTVLLSKLHSPNKCGLVHLAHELNIPKPLFNASKDL